MSADEFFSNLARGWRKGWESAGIFSITPSVGRGLFSNWFLSERERELQELRFLYEEAHATYMALKFTDDEELTRVMIIVMTDVFARCSIPATLDLIGSLYSPVVRILDEEFFNFPEMDEDDWGRLNLNDRMELRRDLMRKQRFFSDVDHLFGLGCHIIILIVSGILRNTNDDAIEEDNVESQALCFQTALIDLVIDAPETIEATLGTVFGKRVLKNELFVPLIEQLEHNLLLASGIEPWKHDTTQKPLVMPMSAKIKAPPILVDTYLAGTPFVDLFEAPLPISIPDAVRFEHAHILGGTGHGKTQLLQRLIHHDLMTAGEKPPSVIVMDSQGDLINTISHLAEFSPQTEDSLAERLIIIDPNDVEYPVALNMFVIDQDRIKDYSPADRERVLNSVIDLYEYVFSALLGAELTQKQGVVFRYLARLMLVIPNATLQTLRELMEDGRPFQSYMQNLDGSAKRFFDSEFFSPSFSATKKQILRRLWGVLANPVFERMFSHPENRIDLFEAMNDGKIILINTAKDLLKPEGCSIFGRFFIAKIAQAALERATIAESDRRPTFVYIDEAHDYFDDTIEHLLNQARKYKVGLTLAHQNLDQLSPKLRASVMASTSLKFAGGVSAKDARAIAEDMNTDADFIRSMRKRRGRTEFATYAKNRTARALRINVELGQIEALPSLSNDRYEALINLNRKRYCATLEEINALIAQSTPPKAPKESFSPPQPKQPKEVVSQNSSTELTSERKPEHPSNVASERSEALTRPQSAPSQADPYVSGLGGQQHRYLQQLIRGLAQERGFKATIEKPVLDDAGKVDVALEHEKLSIAVEISITTDHKHELGNIEKCFRAGFDQVVLIVKDKRKRAKYGREISDKLPDSQNANFHVFGPEEISGFLDKHAAKLASSEKTTRGYRVKVRHSASTPEEAARKREMISRVIAKSILNSKKN